MHIALCILTRNERPCVEVVIPHVPPPGPTAGYDTTVVIDGGSTDGTREYFAQRGFSVICQTEQGRGQAFLTAFEGVETDAYIFFSPDGNEDPADLPKFRQLLEQDFDLVIASRMMKGARNEEDGRVLTPRKWANKAFNLAANLVFRPGGTHVTDSINGYRAITREAARRLSLDARDFTIEYQMTMRALKHGLRIAEFPTIEHPRVAGETQAQSIQTGLRFLRAFFCELRTNKSTHS
jgi:glycosyltransferase involved in cell wall biosynthesis